MAGQGSERDRWGEWLTWGSPGRMRTIGRRQGGRWRCRRRGAGPAALSDRTAPDCGTAALPLDQTEPGNSSSSCNRTGAVHFNTHWTDWSWVWTGLRWTSAGFAVEDKNRTHFLATERASASASWIPFFIVSVKTELWLKQKKVIVLFEKPVKGKWMVFSPLQSRRLPLLQLQVQKLKTASGTTRA